MPLYSLCEKKPEILWGSDGGADGFDWEVLGGGAMIVLGSALTVMGATRKDPVAAVPGVALAGASLAFGIGAAVNVMPVSMKLPSGPRPGPPFGKVGSASVSTRSALIPFCWVWNVKV